MSDNRCRDLHITCPQSMDGQLTTQKNPVDQVADLVYRMYIGLPVPVEAEHRFRPR
jgi:hypothetical protein